MHLLKGGITVTGPDNGRGIPIDKRSALETVLTVLHAGWPWFGFPMRKIRRRQTMPVLSHRQSTTATSHQQLQTADGRLWSLRRQRAFEITGGNRQTNVTVHRSTLGLQPNLRVEDAGAIGIDV